MRALLGAVAPAVAAVVFGWGAAPSSALLAPEEMASGTVVYVSDVPAAIGTVTDAEFRHELVLSAAAEGQRVPEEGGPGYARLKHLALASLLERVWLKGQGAEMGIVVGARQVSRRLARIRRESFESAAEYHELLRKLRYTRRDVRDRVEVQLLAERIVRRVTAGTRSGAEEGRVLEAFVHEYNEKWRSRTVCAPGYILDRCSNGPPLKR